MKSYAFFLALALVAVAIVDSRSVNNEKFVDLLERIVRLSNPQTKVMPELRDTLSAVQRRVNVRVETIQAKKSSSPTGRINKRQDVPDSCTAAYAAMPESTMCNYWDSTDYTNAGISSDDVQVILDTHNNFRSQVDPSASGMVKMYYDEEIAKIAQKYARVCPDGHDSNEERKVPGYGIGIGQNLAWGYSDWEAAITGWHSEVEIFQYGVDPNTYLGANEMVGHYTQVANENAIAVGCGFADCPSGYGSMMWGTYVCNYAYGQYDYMFPYGLGTPCSECPDSCVDNMCDCGNKICFNGGTLDRETCTCDCPDLYNGDQCEELNCPTSDTSLCGSFYTESSCITYYNVPYECPYLCGVCPGGSSYESEEDSQEAESDESMEVNASPVTDDSVEIMQGPGGQGALGNQVSEEEEVDEEESEEVIAVSEVSSESEETSPGGQTGGQGGFGYQVSSEESEEMVIVIEGGQTGGQGGMTNTGSSTSSSGSSSGTITISGSSGNSITAGQGMVYYLRGMSSSSSSPSSSRGKRRH